eukprot:4286715-Alexandrium_andersonii.AAC.1
MSASLVGSEMCIRDRRTLRRRPNLCAQRALGACAVGPKLHTQAACVCAVSYTHLTLPTICSV